jgi:hypothetical protein
VTPQVAEDSGEDRLAKQLIRSKRLYLPHKPAGFDEEVMEWRVFARDMARRGVRSLLIS